MFAALSLQVASRGACNLVMRWEPRWCRRVDGCQKRRSSQNVSLSNGNAQLQCWYEDNRLITSLTNSRRWGREMIGGGPGLNYKVRST